MAETVSQLLSEARGLCREPSHDDLPIHFMVRAYNRVEQFLNNTLTLSRQNHRLAKKYLGTPAREFSVSELENGSLVTVEVRVNQQDDSWDDIYIVNRTAINQASRDGQRRAAQYGSKIRLSWTPQDSNDVLQIWYEPGREIAVIGDSPQIKTAFHPLMAYLLAKECWEGWMGKDSRSDINDGIEMFMRQWEKDVNKTPEQRPQLRGAAYGVGRFGGQWQ